MVKVKKSVKGGTKVSKFEGILLRGDTNGLRT